MLKQFMKSRKGFTLVELMVVVVILGILTSIAIPVYNTTQENARTRACQANQRIIEGAYQQYIANEGKPLESAINNITDTLGDYLKAEPHCPNDEGVYTLDTNGDAKCSVHDYYGE